MERDKLAIIFEALAKADPESEQRIQAIREGIKKLPEVPAYRAFIEDLHPSEVFEKGDRNGDAHFQAVLLRFGDGDTATKALRLNVYGDQATRAFIRVDFMIALLRRPDARAGDHDDLAPNQDQLYWRLSESG